VVRRGRMGRRGLEWDVGVEQTAGRGGMGKARAYAEIRGYRLEVPPGWDALSVAERVVLQNGVGPECWPEAYRAALDELTGFRAAADVHDVDYCLGRTSEDRLAADRRLFWNCMREVVADARGLLRAVTAEWKWTLARVLLARTMYRAVRVGGRQAFVMATKVDLRVRGQTAVTEYDDLYEGEV
jgi:hypothetical protein